MWAALLVSIVSSMEIPIHYKEVDGIHEFPFMFMANDSGVNPLYISKSHEFFAKVTIGGQELNLSLDLINAETRVALSECQCTKKPLFTTPTTAGTHTVLQETTVILHQRSTTCTRTLCQSTPCQSVNN